MKLVITLVLIGFSISIAAFIILVTKFFYPYHRIVAVAVYGVSLLPIIYSFFLYRWWIHAQASAVQDVMTPYFSIIITGAVLLLFIYLVSIIVPFEKSVISRLPKHELAESMANDTEAVLALHARNKTLLKHISELSIITDNPTAPNQKQREELRQSWNEFVTIFFELDVVKNRYRTFMQIPFITRPVEHNEAYLLVYSSLTEEYTALLNLHSIVKDNEQAKKIMNERQKDTFVSDDFYTLLTQQLTNPQRLLKLSAGRGYLSFVDRTYDGDSKLLPMIKGHMNIIEGSLAEYPDLIVKNPLSLLEKKAFDFWFPIQKAVAVRLSNIRAVDRPYFLSPKILQGELPSMQPGDILLERRTWHATNAGIPGFWPHAAIFTGSLEEMDNFFTGIEILNGKKASEYIKDVSPIIYEELNQKDENDFDKRVIEAKRPGVVFFSFEESANADGLVVLRSRLSKNELFEVLMNAFSHFGKPYDFNFDFTTDNALVCSELVYKAYEGKINFEPTMQNGRLLLSPNSIAKKFSDEYNSEHQELDFILFFDPNEKKERADKKGVEEFITTWNRPKWESIAEGVIR